jgi:4-amino-4-deoxy-L-arabinose transferase-like glycosyltransferase
MLRNLSWPWRLFLVALAARFVAIALFFNPQSPELWEYEEIAANLLAGKGYLYTHFGTEYRSYTEPPYPFLVAFVYLVTGHSFLALAVVQALISALLAPVTYALGQQTVPRLSAILAGLLVAIHPGLIGYALKFHTLVLDSLFLALVLLATLRVAERQNLREAMIWGVAIGSCVLARPTVLGFLPLGLGWIFAGLPVRQAARFSALALAVATTVVSPWVIRNYAVHGGFVLTRTNPPFVFWLGNHPNATGSAISQKGTPLFDLAPPDFRDRVFSADELGQNQIFWEEAKRYIWNDPIGFVGRATKKFFYFWWFSPQAGFSYPKWQFRFYQTIYIFILLSAALGLVAVRRRNEPIKAPAIVLLLFFLLSISAFQSLFYVEGRHRLAVEGVLLVLSAHGLRSICFAPSRR